MQLEIVAAALCLCPPFEGVLSAKGVPVCLAGLAELVESLHCSTWVHRGFRGKAFLSAKGLFRGIDELLALSSAALAFGVELAIAFRHSAG